MRTLSLLGYVLFPVRRRAVGGDLGPEGAVDANGANVQRARGAGGFSVSILKEFP